jgi:hypothetical protein
MSTWTTIFPDVDGSPVRGEPGEFRAARSHFRSMEEDARSIVEQFARFRDGGQATGNLEGEAADAFARFVDDVGGELDELPRIAEEAYGFLDDHLTELDHLKEWAEVGADSALARARVAWDTKRDLEDDADRLRTQVSQLRTQVDNAEEAAANAPEPDPGAADEIDGLNGQLGSAAGSLRLTEQGIDDQERILAGIRGEWDDIRAAEERLNRTTGEGLDDIDLGDLKDPKWYEKIVSGVAGLVGVVVDIALGPLDELIVAIATGDWATFFWELKEMLDTVLMVMAVVALFCPLTAPLVAAIFIISLVAFAVTVGLYATQTPNPETGETVGLGDVLISGAGVALALGGGMQAIKAARGLPSTFQYRSGLQALADTGMDLRAVLRGTGGTSPILHGSPGTAGAMQRLGVQSLPIPAGTPLLQSVPHLLTSPGGGMATVRLLKDINDALPPGLPHLPGQTPTVTGLLDASTDGSLIDGFNFESNITPNNDVFNNIAMRHRFDDPATPGSAPSGQQVVIVPVGP